MLCGNNDDDCINTFDWLFDSEADVSSQSANLLRVHSWYESNRHVLHLAPVSRTFLSRHFHLFYLVQLGCWLIVFITILYFQSYLDIYIDKSIAWFIRRYSHVPIDEFNVYCKAPPYSLVIFNDPLLSLVFLTQNTIIYILYII